MKDNAKQTTEQKRVCLQLVHVKKDYYVDKKPFTAIHDLSVCFPDKGFVAILGHSGSGKTTLLNIIGGLDHYTDGDMIIDGKSTKEYKDRDWDNYRNKRIGFVFQSYNLIPHLSVLQNVVMSLQLSGLGRKEREERAAAVLDKVGLSEYAKKDRTNFPAVRCNASPLPALWLTTLTSSSPTNPPALWIPPPRSRSWTSSVRWVRIVASSWLPITANSLTNTPTASSR